ncbi:hypothetical protein F5B19DRAFT_473769 [Rostrohypoxylon terebratum]|nr:hypothetical protein F5B19DRAFT_473769 [Rostrohypoxylon terebratum]
MTSNKTESEPYYGLKKVVPAEGVTDNTTVDIIAIHGLETESPRTWIYKKEGSQAVNWLEDNDMLQTAVPQARIYTYNWDARVFDNAPVQTLLGHADTLLSLVNGEQGPNRRPIIFIASCFGGLILAEAMNRAGQIDSPYQCVLLRTAGILFLATPFCGSNAAKPANWCMVVGGIMGKQTSERLVEDLNKEDKELQKLTVEFAELMYRNSVRLPVHCFYETSKTTVLRRWFSPKLTTMLPSFINKKAKLLLVPEDSACLHGFPRHRLDGNHSMTHKFDGPKNANYYQQIRNVTKSIVDEALTLVERESGPFACQDTIEEIRQNGAHTRLQVDKMHTTISRLEAQFRIEDASPTALLMQIRDELRTYAHRHSEIADANSHVETTVDTVNSTFEIDISNRAARFSSPTTPSFPQATHDSSRPTRHLSSLSGLKCTCKVRESLKLWNYGPLGFKIESRGAQCCPFHGKRRSTNYTVEAKLTPWINRTLELALALGSGKITEICPSLKFRAIVKRSDSPVFQLFDRVLDECVTVDTSVNYNYPYAVPGIIARSGTRKVYKAFWDYRRSSRAMQELVRELIEVIMAGKASGDDSDENGNTLLIEIIYLIILMQGYLLRTYT